MGRIKELSIKEKKFVHEYVKSEGNGTQAALKAYDTEDYSTASAIASENLEKPKIKKAIEEALVKLDITPEKILKRFDRLAEKQEETNPMAAIRANENLAQIAELYPNAKNVVDIGDGHLKISWNG